MDIRVSVAGDGEGMGEDCGRVGTEKSFVLVYKAEFLEELGSRESEKVWECGW